MRVMQATNSTLSLKGVIMQYFINKKNIKQSIQNLNHFLIEKGYNVPRNILLEGFSKALFFKNWNTLEGLTSKPTIIQHISERKSYMIEVEGEISQEKIIDFIKQSFKEGNCHAVMDNFIGDNNSYHIEISFPGKNDNFLTSMFLLANYLKPYQIKRFELLRIVLEKENLLGALNLQFGHKK